MLALCGFVFSFCIWTYQMKCKRHIARLSRKAQDTFDKEKAELAIYNSSHPDKQVELTSGWLELYRRKLNFRHVHLLISVTFAYILFISTIYTEMTTENFYKLLSVSTSTFLAVVGYLIQLTKP